MTRLKYVFAAEASADFRAVFVDGATPADKKFTVVVNDQAVGAGQAELQADCTQLLKAFVLAPGQSNIGEGAAAGTATFPAAFVAVERLVEQDSSKLDAGAIGQRHGENLRRGESR